MKLYTAQSLLDEIRRHIHAGGFNFFTKFIAPYVHTYTTQTEGNKYTFSFVDENTYNEVLNTAIRARKANPADIDKADQDFALLVQNIEKPCVERIYTLVDVANGSQLNPNSAYIWLRNSKVHKQGLPFDFLETNNVKVQVLDEKGYKEALDYLNEYGPRPRTHELKEPEMEQTTEVAKTQETGLCQYRYAPLDTVYKALTAKFNLEYSQCRACLNGIGDFIPMCKARRGKKFERFFTIEVAEKLVELVDSCDSSKDFVRKAINLYDNAETQELYSITEVAQATSYDFKQHDYSGLITLAYSLGLGGSFKDRQGYLFTAEEKDQFVKAYEQRRTKPEPAKLEPIAQPRTDDGFVHISINGLDLKLGRVEALKIAQSIMNQLA